MEVFHLILYFSIKGVGIKGYMKSTDDSLGKQEEAKQGNRWDWIQSQVNPHTLLLHRWVQDSQQFTFNTVTNVRGVVVSALLQ